MNYQFPIINHIDDVLPHIEGFPEIVVAERPFFTIINYMVATPQVFRMEGPDDLGGAMRRECRGLAFYPDGRLMSRPFHKFFNIGQVEETQMNVLDFSQPHTVFTKEDGSFLRPLMAGDQIKFGTKMGFSDVADVANKYIDEHLNIKQFGQYCMERELTPIFEYVGPYNKIVIHHEVENMILLAVRDNKTGVYVSLDPSIVKQFNLQLVKSHGQFGSAQELVEYTRPLREVEGFVVDFGGHRVKCKADHYVEIHQLKDDIRLDRNIAKYILKGELDDKLPILDEFDFARVKKYEVEFGKMYENVIGRIEGLVMIAKTVYEGLPKRVALEFVPNLLNSGDAAFIFAALNGKDIRAMLKDRLLQAVGNTTKYEEMIMWMEG